MTESLTATQRRYLVATVGTPPSRLDPARELLPDGTRHQFIKLGFLTDDGYLTALGIAVGLALAD